MKKIFDVHMHIMPKVDDGSQSITESIQLLKRSLEQGVTDIIATPHSSAFDYYLSNVHVEHMYKALCEEVQRQDIKINIYRGCEILCYGNAEAIVEKLDLGQYKTMNDTRYVLIEFDPYKTKAEDVKYFVNTLLRNKYMPVIAHAERYGFSNTNLIRTIKSMGAIIQINAYSIQQEKKENIKALTSQLLNEKLVDLLGSDAHRMNHRPPEIITGIDFLYNNYENEYVNNITYNNAKRLFIGGEI